MSSRVCTCFAVRNDLHKIVFICVLVLFCFLQVHHKVITFVNNIAYIEFGEE